MRTALQRFAMLTVILVGSLLGGAAPAHAKNMQIDGTAFFDPNNEVCEGPPAGYSDYPALVLQGSLEGCWYTDVQWSKKTPSGVYLERGRELFVGSLDGREGSFTTTYRFEAKFAPDGVTELFGRCQHPLLAGSGTGEFTGATGRLDFKDIINGSEITYVYRGHISLR